VLVAGTVTSYTTTASGTVDITRSATPGGSGSGGTGGPTANAGSQQQQAFTRTYTLDARQSTGTGTLTYLWRIPAGARSATILNPTSSQPQIIFGEGFGNYDVELIVTDANGVASQPMKITITYLGSNPF
jgi:hypothetical protein